MRVDEKAGTPIQPDRAVTVLNVSPVEADHLILAQIFSHSNWKLHVARTCSEAMALLETKLLPVVLCEQELPDGSWKDILERANEAANPPTLIVSSRLADDRLWSEVLNLGGYNVLSKPFRESEVFRDVSLAWLAWKNRGERIKAQRETQHRPRALGAA